MFLHIRVNQLSISTQLLSWLGGLPTLTNQTKCTMIIVAQEAKAPVWVMTRLANVTFRHYMMLEIVPLAKITCCTKKLKINDNKGEILRNASASWGSRLACGRSLSPKPWNCNCIKRQPFSSYISPDAAFKLASNQVNALVLRKTYPRFVHYSAWEHSQRIRAVSNYFYTTSEPGH